MPPFSEAMALLHLLDIPLKPVMETRKSRLQRVFVAFCSTGYKFMGKKEK